MHITKEKKFSRKTSLYFYQLTKKRKITLNKFLNNILKQGDSDVTINELELDVFQINNLRAEDKVFDETIMQVEKAGKKTMKAIALKRLYDFALQEDTGQKLLLPYLKQIGAIKEEQVANEEEQEDKTFKVTLKKTFRENE